MRVLVTGASGFVGKNMLLSMPADAEVVALYNQSTDFLDFVNQNNAGQIIPVQLDLRDTDRVARFAAQFPAFDACIFLAANGDPAVSVKAPFFDLSSNAGTLVSLLEQVAVETMIYFSSGAVYHGLTGAVSPAVPVAPTLPYAISKRSAEQYLAHFQQTGQINAFVNVRFFGAFGPYEPDRKIYTKLVRQFAIEKNDRFTLRGDGNNLIDAMYVDDAIRAVHLLLARPEGSTTLDLYSAKPVTLKRLVETAGQVFDIEPQISYEGSVPEYIQFYSVDQTMKKSYGFEPEVGLEEGLRHLYEHLISRRRGSA